MKWNLLLNMSTPEFHAAQLKVRPQIHSGGPYGCYLRTENKVCIGAVKEIEMRVGSVHQRAPIEGISETACGLLPYK